MQQAPRRGANPSTASSTATNAEPQDAIALLKADHRQVEELFEAFASSDSDEEKAGLAESICDALTIHAQIEEELFYPAFLEATGDEDLYHEAAIERAAEGAVGDDQAPCERRGTGERDVREGRRIGHGPGCPGRADAGEEDGAGGGEA
jgi:hypothetical protein